MTEVRFYHVQRDIAAKAAPPLIQKAMAKGLRILIKTPDAERRAFYDDYLWRFDPTVFLPHGQEGDPMPEAQPVWVSTQDNAPNGAKMALVVEGAALPAPEGFELVCALFDSENEAALEQVRRQWKELKARSDLVLAYWKQETNGAWTKQEI